MMLRFLSADWFRISRFWLAWALLVILAIIVVLQVNGKIDRLRELEEQLAAVQAEVESAMPSELAVVQGLQDEIAWLRERLSYPAFITQLVRYFPPIETISFLWAIDNSEHCTL